MFTFLPSVAIICNLERNIRDRGGSTGEQKLLINFQFFKKDILCMSFLCSVSISI